MSKPKDDNLMSEREFAEQGKRLARAVSELAELRKDKQEAMASMQEGIVAQEKEVARIANIIRSGQRELFGAAPPPETDGKSASAGEVAQ